MDAQRQVFDILTLSGVPPSRARLLARVIDNIYETMPRPDPTLVKQELGN